MRNLQTNKNATSRQKQINQQINKSINKHINKQTETQKQPINKYKKHNQ